MRSGISTCLTAGSSKIPWNRRPTTEDAEGQSASSVVDSQITRTRSFLLSSPTHGVHEVFTRQVGEEPVHVTWPSSSCSVSSQRRAGNGRPLIQIDSRVCIRLAFAWYITD